MESIVPGQCPGIKKDPIFALLEKNVPKVTKTLYFHRNLENGRHDFSEGTFQHFRSRRNQRSHSWRAIAHEHAPDAAPRCSGRAKCRTFCENKCKKWPKTAPLLTEVSELPAAPLLAPAKLLPWADGVRRPPTPIKGRFSTSSLFHDSAACALAWEVFS